MAISTSNIAIVVESKLSLSILLHHNSFEGEKKSVHPSSVNSSNVTHGVDVIVITITPISSVEIHRLIQILPYTTVITLGYKL